MCTNCVIYINTDNIASLPTSVNRFRAKRQAPPNRLPYTAGIRCAGSFLHFYNLLYKRAKFIKNSSNLRFRIAELEQNAKSLCLSSFCARRKYL